MENKMTKSKLNDLVSMLEGRKITNTDSKIRVEMAKLKLLKNDPGFEISKELSFINRGEFRLALLNFVERKFITPTLYSLFTRK